MNCDMCGKEDVLFKTDVEGSIMNVCKACSKFGKIIAQIKPRIEQQHKHIGKAIQKSPEKELMQVIVSDYAQIIKQKREKLDLKQEDFAKQINEKVSLIHQIETGHFEPNIELARKLEKALRIKLVEEHEEVHSKGQQVKSDKFTIGDFIKVK